MALRVTASAMASASAASVLKRLTNGFTYAGGINRTSWPSVRISRAQWWALPQANLRFKHRQLATKLHNVLKRRLLAREQRLQGWAASLPLALDLGKAKLVEGQVEMTLNYSLEPWEMERGFILTCQAVPKSERLVVDYDQM